MPIIAYKSGINGNCAKNKPSVEKMCLTFNDTFVILDSRKGVLAKQIGQKNNWFTEGDLNERPEAPDFL